MTKWQTRDRLSGHC